MKVASSALRISPTTVRGQTKSVVIRRHSNTPQAAILSASHLPPPRIDYKSICDNILFKSHNAFNRRAALPVGTFQSVARLYGELKSLSNDLNHKLALRNTTSELVRTSSRGSTTPTAAIEQGRLLKTEIATLRARLAGVEAELLRVVLPIPNDTHPESPIGPEAAATILATHGPNPLPATPFRDHVRVARSLNMLDLEAGATVTGSSWYYLTNEGALLELALTNYAVSVAIQHGYTPVVTPDVVRADIAMRCGFQPRDGDVQQMYHLDSEAGKDQLVLSGTAEIPLAGFFANQVFEESQLPRKVVGVGKAFRAEAGARGADTRGLYRVHQFSKVELFAVTSTGNSEELLDDMRKVQVDILTGLGLPFRVLDMPTEDLGASAYRKFDIEVWMPGRGRWGEVTSASDCTDYQSRRLHIRYRHKETAGSLERANSEKQPLLFAHTLNGTAAAIPRLIVALLENGVRLGEAEEVQGLDLPHVLQAFWVGKAEDKHRKGAIHWV